MALEWNHQADDWTERPNTADSVATCALKDIRIFFGYPTDAAYTHAMLDGADPFKNYRSG